MSVTGSVIIQGSIGGLAVGTKSFGPTTISSTTASDATCAPISITTLASGANTITVPSVTNSGCIIQFAAASTCTKTLKGVTGDTGVVLAKVGTNVLNFESGSAPASFCITASAADTGNITTIWWF